MTALLVASALLYYTLLPLPLDETVELNSEVELCDETAGLFEVSELVFTLESVTRRISILGWSSERYDLEIGTVLKGNLDEETVSLYVFPELVYSSQFASLTEGSGVTVFASLDSTQSFMEGFRTDEGDWAVQLYVQAFEAEEIVEEGS